MRADVGPSFLCAADGLRENVSQSSQFQFLSWEHSDFVTSKTIPEAEHSHLMYQTHSKQILLPFSIVQDIISCSLYVYQLYHGVLSIDTSPRGAMALVWYASAHSHHNEVDARVVREHVYLLNDRGIAPKDIVILSFYEAQVRLLKGNIQCGTNGL